MCGRRGSAFSSNSLFDSAPVKPESPQDASMPTLTEFKSCSRFRRPTQRHPRNSWWRVRRFAEGSPRDDAHPAWHLSGPAFWPRALPPEVYLEVSTPRQTILPRDIRDRAPSVRFGTTGCRLRYFSIEGKKWNPHFNGPSDRLLGNRRAIKNRDCPDIVVSGVSGRRYT